MLDWHLLTTNKKCEVVNFWFVYGVGWHLLIYKQTKAVWELAILKGKKNENT